MRSLPRSAWFALGFVSALAAPVAAQQVVIRCQPVIVEIKPCDNALKMHFERGYVPNRCKVT